MILDRRAFHHALLGLFAVPAVGCARRDTSESPHRVLYLLDDEARQSRVLAGARQEGTVAIYTSLNTQDSVPLTSAFEERYGVKTELWRSSSEPRRAACCRGGEGRSLCLRRLWRRTDPKWRPVSAKGCSNDSTAPTSRTWRRLRFRTTGTTSLTASTFSPSRTTPTSCSPPRCQIPTTTYCTHGSRAGSASRPAMSTGSARW